MFGQHINQRFTATDNHNASPLIYFCKSLTAFYGTENINHIKESIGIILGKTRNGVSNF